jgi:glycerol uptake facilitator-like aquaporin
MFLTLAAISSMILFPVILDSTPAIAVIPDALVVGFAPFVLIERFGPISGAHLNPIVSIAVLQENEDSKNNLHSGSNNRRISGIIIISPDVLS